MAGRGLGIRGDEMRLDSVVLKLKGQGRQSSLLLLWRGGYR